MRAHFWSTEHLVVDLATGMLEPRLERTYMLLAGGLFTLTVFGASVNGGYMDWIALLDLVCMLAITLVGVNEAFKANGGTSGQQFILRLSTLSVPLGSRFFLLGIALNLLYLRVLPGVLTGGLVRDPELVYSFLAFVTPLALTFAFYWRLAHHLSRLRVMTAARAA